MAATHAVIWQRARVVESVRLTALIQRIVLQPEAPVRALAGAHLDVRVVLDGRTEKRSYSIVDASPDGSRVALSVYQSPISRGAAAVLRSLSVGDEVEVTQPMLDFPLRVGAPSYVLLAGGIGITALVAMARVLRSMGANYRLVYVGRSRAVMAYVDALAAEHGDRLELHVGDEGTPLRVPALVESLDETTELYMCGPIRLMDAVRRGWEARGLRMPNLRFETFGNSGWFAPQEFTVHIPALGIEARVGTGESMLEALEAAGVEMMYDCRKGECGLCEVRVIALSGSIDHRDVFYSERQKNATGKMCCCVSRAVSTPDGRAGRVVIETG